MEVKADDVVARCPCGYQGRYMQVHAHKLGSRKQECKGRISLIVKPPQEITEEEEEPSEPDEDVSAEDSRWETEDSEDELEYGSESPQMPTTRQAPSESSVISAPTKKPSLIALDVPPTIVKETIRLTVENLALFDLDRGEEYEDTLEQWVNEVIKEHFEYCQRIYLRGVQLIPIEAAGGQDG